MSTTIASRVLSLALALSLPAAWAAPVKLEPGDRPPSDQVGQTLSGEPVRLKDFAGKAVVLSFWATWCEYCMKEMPILANIQSHTGKKGVQVLAVNVEDRDVFRKVVPIMEPLNLALAYDPKKIGQKAFGVDGLPHMVIIGRDGRVVRAYLGYDESMLPKIVADLNQAIAAPMPAATAASAVIASAAP